MATLTEYPIITSTPPLPDINATYDQELDSFLNLDQFSYSASEPVKGQPALATQSSISSSDASTSALGCASFSANRQS
jgi:hypothetical protein